MKNTMLLVAFLLLLRPVLPVAEYVVNYEYVSKVLCVNKATPAMHCNGKCHLMKELARAAESEKPISSDKKNAPHENETLFFEEMPRFNLSSPVVFRKPPAEIHYSNLYASLYPGVVFRPPAHS